MKKILILFNIFIALLIVFALTIFFNFFVFTKKYENKTLKVTNGETFTQIYKDMGMKLNFIDKIYLDITGNSAKVKVGTYSFNGKYTKYKIIDKIVNSDTKMIKLTIPEGFTSQQIFNRIVELNLGTKEEIQEVLKNIEYPYLHPNGNFEGYFYPETYIFSEGTKIDVVIKTILGEFLKKFPPEQYPNKEKFYEDLKLASIVEAEVNNSQDKPKVAGIFINRMKKNMKLESDATLKYELGRQAYKGELKNSDSPYNSYKYKGLPPTPISNPSLETFNAVLKPEISNDLFFFMYDGKTYYSVTHNEHLKKRRETGQLK